jgi:hypothetical protein
MEHAVPDSQTFNLVWLPPQLPQHQQSSAKITDNLKIHVRNVGRSARGTRGPGAPVVQCNELSRVEVPPRSGYVDPDDSSLRVVGSSSNSSKLTLHPPRLRENSQTATIPMGWQGRIARKSSLCREYQEGLSGSPGSRWTFPRSSTGRSQEGMHTSLSLPLSFYKTVTRKAHCINCDAALDWTPIQLRIQSWSQILSASRGATQVFSSRNLAHS